MDEKLRYRDEFEDYTSLPFERDLELHTSLGRAKARTAASERGKRVECGARQAERLGREQLELQLGWRENELGVASQQVQDTYRRQSDLKSTVKYH